MKKVFLKIVGAAALATLICAVFAQVLVSGQNTEKEQSEEFIQNFGNRSIEGTWQTVITLRNCQTGAAVRSFPAVLSFHQGGTLTGDSTVVSPALKTGSYGVWERERGWQQYSFAFMFFVFNPDGTLAGSQKVRQFANLRADSNYFTTTGTVEISNANGNVIATGCSTSTGTRFE